MNRDIYSSIFLWARDKGLPKWYGIVYYGIGSWPSRSEWMVPGTFGAM